MEGMQFLKRQHSFFFLFTDNRGVRVLEFWVSQNLGSVYRSSREQVEFFRDLEQTNGRSVY